MEEVFKIMVFAHQTEEHIKKHGDSSQYFATVLMHPDFYNYEDAKKHVEEEAPKYQSQDIGINFYFKIEQMFKAKKLDGGK